MGKLYGLSHNLRVAEDSAVAEAFGEMELGVGPGGDQALDLVEADLAVAAIVDGE